LAGQSNWLDIRKPTHDLDPEVDLDRGEREAISLAEEVAADVLLVDDWDARQERERRGRRTRDLRRTQRSLALKRPDVSVAENLGILGHQRTVVDAGGGH
jgi:hypothetical protein